MSCCYNSYSYMRQAENQAMPGYQFNYPTNTSQPQNLISQQAPLYPLPVIGTTLPTGMPTGPAPVGAITPPPLMVQVTDQAPETVQSPQYTPGFLRTQIGRRMRVEFLIGTGALIDRIGTLVGVGASYILLRPVDSNDIILCDIYSIKFVTIYL